MTLGILGRMKLEPVDPRNKRAFFLRGLEVGVNLIGNEGGVSNRLYLNFQECCYFSSVW